MLPGLKSLAGVNQPQPVHLSGKKIRGVSFAAPPDQTAEKVSFFTPSGCQTTDLILCTFEKFFPVTFLLFFFLL